MLKSIFIFLGLSVVLLGDSLPLAHYIKDLKGMVLVKESMIPGKDVVLPKETPLFVQQTVSMYNWINNGKGTKLNIYMPKGKAELFVGSVHRH